MNTLKWSDRGLGATGCETSRNSLKQRRFLLDRTGVRWYVSCANPSTIAQEAVSFRGVSGESTARRVVFVHAGRTHGRDAERTATLRSMAAPAPAADHRPLLATTRLCRRRGRGGAAVP